MTKMINNIIQIIFVKIICNKRRIPIIRINIPWTICWNISLADFISMLLNNSPAMWYGVPLPDEA